MPLVAAAALARAPPARGALTCGLREFNTPTAFWSPRWKAKERRPFLATSCFLKHEGASVLAFPGEAPVFPVDFFFDDARDAFLPALLEDFVVMVIAPLVC
jgi:hypothetical protein